MRFMIIRKADKQTEAGELPNAELMTAMQTYMEDLNKAGVLLEGEGLHPSAKGARIKFAGGKPTVKDGPFAETKELVAGYLLIKCASMAEAVDWMKRWPPIDAGGGVELEIRQIQEAADFPPEVFPPETAAREQAMRDELSAKKK